MLRRSHLYFGSRRGAAALLSPTPVAYSILSHHKDPDIHRHSQSTFHEGGHREPPRPNRKPWRDNMSPMEMFQRWIRQPTSRLSHFWWMFLISLVGYYTFCLSFDIKAHYLMNDNLHRKLHLERTNTIAMKQRVKDLETALISAAVAVPEKSATLKRLENQKEAPLKLSEDEEAVGVTNYEFELARERGRAGALNMQHQQLVHELADVRAINMRLTKELENARKDAAQLQRQLDSVHKAVDG